MATLQHRRNKRNRANAIFNQPEQVEYQRKLRRQLVKTASHLALAEFMVALVTQGKDTSKWANSVARTVRKVEEYKNDYNQRVFPNHF